MTTIHKNLTGADLHEPKGADTATSGKVYVSNGAGSGVWTATTALLDTTTITGVTLVTPILGVATATSIAASTSLLVNTSAGSTGGIGYTTGAGGTVTQVTSRTTAVTINKLCGSITMVTGAGSPTPAQFVVVNSMVAIRDVVVVSVKTSNNAYGVMVTGVAAGQFSITFWSLLGTTSDTPVINFAVIKGAAS